MRNSLKLLLVLALFSGCAATYVDQRQQSPNFHDGKFHNPVANDKTMWDYITSRLGGEWATWPDWIDSEYGAAPASTVADESVVITVINHSTVLIQGQGFNILTDPIYSKRTSPFQWIGPARVRNPGIRFADLPKIDAVLISHDHYDHLDLSTIDELIERDNPRIFTGLGVGNHLDTTELVTEMDWWQKEKLSDELEIHFVPVQHFSGRSLFNRDSTLWGGYVIKLGESKIYFGGDSGYAEHYQQTFDQFGPMDLALLPIGAYAPRSFMVYAHMDPAQAVQAHLDLRAQQSIGMHYGTFQLTSEPFNEPEALLQQETANAGLGENTFITLPFGEALTLSLQ